MDSKLRQLQLCELEILDEFVRICEKHGLQYYLVGGTLLGAVRHQGFIPWDDDIDMAMPREDYDKFAVIAHEDLAPQYFYQCPETDPYYFLTYAKIRKNGTEVYEERFKDAKFHKGVFIDIFPLDFCPTPGPVCHFLFNVLAVMNYRGQVDSGETYVPYQELSGKIGYTMLRVFSPRRLVRLRRKLLSLSKRMSSRKYVACFSGAYGYYREVFRYTWFGNGKTTQFEKQNFLAPQMMCEVVSQLFGSDFEVLPPEQQRMGHLDLEYVKLKTP